MKTKIPKEKRIENAKNANKKRIKQIKELQKKGEYKKTNPTFIEYYLNKGMTQKEAEQALKERQATFSKKKCIEKYGEKEGLKKLEERNNKWINSLKENNDWDELSKKKAITLENMIVKYGKEEGTEKYYNWKELVKNTEENFIKRYGAEEGITKWKLYKSHRYKHYGSSKESNMFFLDIISKIKPFINISEIYMDGETTKEYWLNYNNGNNKFFYDFTIRYLNLIIEYHGTHIHPNPRWNKENWNKWRHVWNKKNADEIRIYDLQKKSLAESQGFKVLEIWNDENVIINQQKSIDFIFNQLP